MQRARQGTNVATTENAQRTRQRHRRALQVKLRELLVALDAAAMAGNVALYEDLKMGVQLTLGDLGRLDGRHARTLAKLSPSPTHRRGAP